MHQLSSKNKPEVIVAAISDIHGFLDGLDEEVHSINPHVLVIAGDMHPCRIDMNADQWFRNKFFPMVRGWANKSIHVVAIPGNHDFWLNDYLAGRIDYELPPNFHLLCDSMETIYGIRFYGTPWVPWINGKWCFEASDKTLEYAYSKIADEVDVLVTHSPPHINHEFVDISLDHQKAFWRHFGSKALSAEIRKKKPMVSFCGHIHSGQHDGVSIKDDGGNEVCKCYNVSRVNEQYQVKYPLTVVRLNPRSETMA